MDQKIKAVVVAGFCLGPGLGDAEVGDIVELTPYQYRQECEELGRVRPMPADETEVNAAALAQAHQDLLQKIATAASMLSLEQLLSEDPEIAAAYEKRMAELEEEAGTEEADRIKAAMAVATSEADAVALIAAAQTISGLSILAGEIPAEEVALHDAITARLSELDSAKG